MTFSVPGFIKGCVISVFVCLLVYLGLRSFGVIGVGSKDPADPVVLAAEAKAALEAVKRRQPGARRPASYDAVMAPLDKLLRQAKSLLASAEYNPNQDLPRIRALAAPVIEIAPLADTQAKSETGPLAKSYRFNDQKGEACQYLASALWERVNANRVRNRTALGAVEPLPPGDLNEIARILDDGIEAAPENRDLRYLRGVVNRAEGLFAPAARDLERAIGIDSDYSAAWNTLGLVRISLREFDAAEEAFEKAKALALEEARRNNSEPGGEYVAVLYNLAMFHEGLATYYNRENRVTPSVESKRLMSKHAAEARRYLEEFIRREPADSSDAREARARLNSLPG